MTRTSGSYPSHGVGYLVAGQFRGRQPIELTPLGQLAHGRNRVIVGEVLRVVIVGGPAGGVAPPPRGLQGDAGRVVEVDRPHDVVVDHVGDRAVRLLQPPL